jgi:formylglycine-generating enzyme required for sulfatase activity
VLVSGVLAGLAAWWDELWLKERYYWFANVRGHVLKAGAIFKECERCPEMVVVPAGEFKMGSAESEKDHKQEEGPQHKVSIAKPFAVSEFEVTFDQWDACVAYGGCVPSVTLPPLGLPQKVGPPHAQLEYRLSCCQNALASRPVVP